MCNKIFLRSVQFTIHPLIRVCIVNAPLVPISTDKSYEAEGLFSSEAPEQGPVFSTGGVWGFNILS